MVFIHSNATSMLCSKVRLMHSLSFRGAYSSGVKVFGRGPHCPRIGQPPWFSRTRLAASLEALRMSYLLSHPARTDFHSRFGCPWALWLTRWARRLNLPLPLLHLTSHRPKVLRAIDASLCHLETIGTMIRENDSTVASGTIGCPVRGQCCKQKSFCSWYVVLLQ
jgi:hypothetical protein